MSYYLEITIYSVTVLKKINARYTEINSPVLTKSPSLADAAVPMEYMLQPVGGISSGAFQSLCYPNGCKMG